jgi:hypothetical protein
MVAAKRTGGGECVIPMYSSALIRVHIQQVSLGDVPAVGHAWQWIPYTPGASTLLGPASIAQTSTNTTCTIALLRSWETVLELLVLSSTGGDFSVRFHTRVLLLTFEADQSSRHTGERSISCTAEDAVKNTHPWVQVAWS